MIKIKIMKDGPYIVCGSIPLLEKIIVPSGNAYELREGRSLPQAAQYSLCRCGKSRKQPFCDGAHVKEGFCGTEVADRTPFLERAEKLTGNAVDLLDDGRCAYARFCHRQAGNIWELINAPLYKADIQESILAASECPAGRLRLIDKQGKDLNIKYSPAIEILQDPEQQVSGPIAVRGGISLESADGTLYELADRYALCRCGSSSIKPFCDAQHVLAGYNDKKSTTN